MSNVQSPGRNLYPSDAAGGKDKRRWLAKQICLGALFDWVAPVAIKISKPPDKRRPGRLRAPERRPPELLFTAPHLELSASLSATVAFPPRFLYSRSHMATGRTGLAALPRPPASPVVVTRRLRRRIKFGVSPPGGALLIFLAVSFRHSR